MTDQKLLSGWPQNPITGWPQQAVEAGFQAGLDCNEEEAAALARDVALGLNFETARRVNRNPFTRGSKEYGGWFAGFDRARDQRRRQP
jgi:hypothetical protein